MNMANGSSAGLSLRNEDLTESRGKVCEDLNKETEDEENEADKNGKESVKLKIPKFSIKYIYIYILEEGNLLTII